MGQEERTLTKVHTGQSKGGREKKNAAKLLQGGTGERQKG